MFNPNSSFAFGTNPAASSTGAPTSVNTANGFNFGGIASTTATPGTSGGFSFGSPGLAFGTPASTSSIMTAPVFGTPAGGATFITPQTTGLPASATPSTGAVPQPSMTGLFSANLTSTPAAGLFSGAPAAGLFSGTPATGLFSGAPASATPSTGAIPQPSMTPAAGLFSGAPATQSTGLFSNPSSTQASGIFGVPSTNPPASQNTGLFSGRLPTSQVSGLGGSMTFTGLTNPQMKPLTTFGTPTQSTQAHSVPSTTFGSTFSFGSTTTTAAGLSFITQETAAKPAGGFTFGAVTNPAVGGITPAFGGTNPAFGGTNPVVGGITPAFGGTTPAFGGTTPAVGGTNPAFGGTTPAFGTSQTSTTLGPSTASGGIKLGTATPTTGLTTTASSFNFASLKTTTQGTPAIGLKLGTTTTQGPVSASNSAQAAPQTSNAPVFGLGQSTTGYNLSGMLSGQAKSSAGVASSIGTTNTGATTNTGVTATTGLSGTPKATSLLSTTTTNSLTTPKPGFSLTTSAGTPSTGFQLGGGPFASLPTSSTAATGFKLGSSLASTATTTTATSSATGSIATVTPATSAEKYTYKQLEEHVNKWNIELEEMERGFLEQAAQVNVADRELMANGEKITILHTEVERAKAEQKRLDQELDFLVSQQNELNDLLKPLEESVKQHETEYGQEPDREREKIYKMAEKCDGQLKGMLQDLREIIDHLNASNTSQQQEENPVMQIAKILNVHMDSLQWIDQNSALLQKRVDEIARLGEIRKKEQERSFRLGFD